MKTKSIILVMLASCFFFIGCDKNNDNEPREIALTEFSLADTSCQWTNLNYDDKLIVINSDEELKNFISCSSESYPEIDFSKYTLLLASGITINGISNITKNLQQISTNRYRLYVEILLNDADIMQNWVLALIASKINNHSRVELKVTTIRN